MIMKISEVIHDFIILGIAVTIWSIGIFFAILTIFTIWERYNGKNK
tara:strand:- start:575 stop:712 length:138 start_codon:yes stop_codon:yes gene_type:complete